MNETQQTPPAVMSQTEADKILNSINVEQIYRDNSVKIIEEQLRNASNQRAAREPLPDCVGMAFDKDKIVVETSIGKVGIRKMVAVDITIFKIIDSPFYKLIMGDIETTDENPNKIFKQLFPDEELLYSVVYQFTHSAKEIYALVKKGKEQFKDKVIEEMIDKAYSPSDLTTLVEVILTHVGMVNQTKASFESAPNEEDKKKQG